MNTVMKASALIALSWVGNTVYAQTPASPPKATPQSEAGEPRADTSKPTSAQSEAGEPRANTSQPPPATAPAPVAGKPAAKAAPAAAAAGQKTPGASDHLELGTATVTGDREQPKVMYIVP